MERFNNNKVIQDWALNFMLIGQVCAVVGRTQAIHLVTTLSVFFVLLSCVMFGVESIFSKFVEKQRPILLSFCTLVIFVIMAVLNSGDFSYENILRCLMFLEIPVFLMAIPKVYKNDFTAKILVINIIISVYYIYYSFSDRAYYFVNRYGYASYNDLTLGFANPNTTATYLLLNLILLISSFFYFKRFMVRFITIVLSVQNVYMIFETHSRTCMLCVIIFIALILILKKKLIRLTQRTTGIFFAIPLLFFCMTVFFPEFMDGLELFGETVSTGRYSIYTRYWEELDIMNILFGNLIDAKFSNLHNAYFAIFMSVGVVATIMVIFLLYKNIAIICRERNEMFQLCAVAGILTLLLQVSAEATVFIEGTYFAAAVFAICCIASSVNREEKHENTIS